MTTSPENSPRDELARVGDEYTILPTSSGGWNLSRSTGQERPARYIGSYKTEENARQAASAHEEWYRESAAALDPNQNFPARDLSGRHIGQRVTAVLESPTPTVYIGDLFKVEHSFNGTSLHITAEEGLQLIALGLKDEVALRPAEVTR